MTQERWDSIPTVVLGECRGGLPPLPGFKARPAAPERGSPEGEYPPLAGVSGGVPLNLSDFSRAGGWEQPRSCCGHHADAAHRAQRPPTTSCNETQAAKRGIGRAACLFLIWPPAAE